MNYTSFLLAREKQSYYDIRQSLLFLVHPSLQIILFQFSVVFHIETSHLLYSVVTGFYIKHNTGLKLFNPFRPNPGRREKIQLNFYFRTSFWCPRRFYEGLKTYTTKKFENKNLTFFLFQYNFQKCTGREELTCRFQVRIPCKCFFSF